MSQPACQICGASLVLVMGGTTVQHVDVRLTSSELYLTQAVVA